MEDKDKEIRQWSELTEEERKALIDSLLQSEQKYKEEQGKMSVQADPHSNFTGREIVLALLGLPAESNPTALSRFPFATVFLVIACFACAAYYTFVNPEVALLLAFYPNEAFRFGGLNFLTCFFVHGGLVHILSNMYALFVFGDNVEDDLGPLFYLLLVALATAAGSTLSWLASPHDAIPHVGASGGIFGVMVYYLLKFPKARFTYLFFFRFYRVPAIFVLAMYLFIQFTGAVQQLAGVGNVDYFAHLGGGLVGLGFWFVARRS